MATPTRFGIQGLQPAFSPELAVTRVVNLPFGGPITGSGYYPQGTILGATQAAAANEVVTLSISGSPTGGTFRPILNFDKAYDLGSLAYNITLANFQAALVAAVPEFAGNVTVTGTAGTTYTCTFNTNLANQRIGGLWSVTSALTGGTTPSAAWARTTRGSCGVGQFDIYAQATNNYTDAILMYDTTLTPGGALIAPGLAQSLVAYSQPFTPTAYFEGFFTTADIANIDANAYTLGKITKVTGGTHIRLI